MFFCFENQFDHHHLDARRWQEYVEPGDELESAQLRRTSRHIESEEEGMDHLLPLPEGVLTRNLGLDIVVVVTKVSFEISPTLSVYSIQYHDDIF